MSITVSLYTGRYDESKIPPGVYEQREGKECYAVTTTIMERLNQLAAERSMLYRLASNGRRGDPAVRRRLAEISLESEALWEQRRRERAGHREGIDLLVDRAYERVYGSNFDEAFAPLHVETAEDAAAALAA